METINDIVREMRESFNQSWHDIDREWARDLAGRIEAAAKRCCYNCAWYNAYEVSLDDMKSENARLRAALKPVLNCDCQLDDYQTKEAYMVALGTAVTEAQRIYNEGEATKKGGARNEGDMR